MIIYVMKSEKANIIYQMLNILKVEKREDKTIIYLPTNNKSRKKMKKNCEKLGKFLYDNNIKNVVLENSLMKNEEAKNILYSYNINILDGRMLSKYLIYNIIQKIYEYKNKKIETGEISVLVNENDEITTQTIKQIAQSTKRLNIITNNIKKFRKLVESLYDELGIIIKLSNNIKTNLKNTDIIVNMDFTEEIINQLDIPNNSTVLNIPNDININSKKFNGINIKNYKIEIPDKYKMDKFNEQIVYEANLYEKSAIKRLEQIQNDRIIIKYLIGVNGIINQKEFVENLKKST